MADLTIEQVCGQDRLGKSTRWLQGRLTEDRRRPLGEQRLQHHHYVGRTPRWTEAEYQALRAGLIASDTAARQARPTRSPEPQPARGPRPQLRIVHVDDMAIKDFIYIIECSGYQKVGLSSDPDARLESLRIGNPLPMRIRLRRSVPRPFVRRVELRVHSALAAHLHFGEWFSCSFEVAKRAVTEALAESVKEQQEQCRFVGELARAEGNG